MGRGAVGFKEYRMASAEWYYARGNQQYGPVSALELKALAEGGALGPDDLVWRAGMGDWVAARRVKGLFETPSPPAGSAGAARSALASTVAPGGGAVPGQGVAVPVDSGPVLGPGITSPPVAVATPPAEPSAADLRAAGPPAFPASPSEPAATPPPGPAVPPATPGAAARELPRRALATFERSSAAFERSRLGERPHLFDYLLDALGAVLSARFTEGTGQLFTLVGHYGLYAAMLLILLVHAIAAVQTRLLVVLGSGVACVLALAVLQYAAGRFANALNRLDHATSGQMVSTAVTDCFALFALLAGPACLIAGSIAAVLLHSYGWILTGLATFVVCQYAAMLALNPESLGLSISPETTAVEEAIGLITFVAKLGIRLSPAIIAAGVLWGTLMLCYALYLAVAHGTPVLPTFAQLDAAPLPGRGNTAPEDWLGSLGRMGGDGSGRDGLEALAGLTRELGLTAQVRSRLQAFGPLVVASSAETVLLFAAAFPLLAYLAFLAAYALADLLRILGRAARSVEQRKGDEKSQP